MAVPRLILMTLLSLVAFTVFAADRDRQYKVRTVDAVETCDGLTRALAKAKTQDDWGSLYGFSLYAMGYVTGINRLAHDTYDIGGLKNTKTLLVWLENYCAEHPEDTFDAALFQLTLEIYPSRTTRPHR